MAKGKSAISAWDHWGAVLKVKQTRFRIVKRNDTSFIHIREIENGKVVRQFSSGIYRPENDEDIAACAAQCIAASQGKGNGWGSTSKPTAHQIVLTWDLLADSALANVQPASICDQHQASAFRLVAPR